MSVYLRLAQLAVSICLAALAGAVCAAESTLDLTLSADRAYAQDAKSFLLAANAADGSISTANEPSVTPDAASDQAPYAEKVIHGPPLVSGSNVHKYLGLGTIVLAGMAAMSAPEGNGEGCEHNSCTVSNAPRDVNGTHAKLAEAAAVMGIAAVASGLISHWDDFSLEDGWSDPDNLHVLLGVTGAALMAYAVNKSMNSSVPVSHAGIAELGALGMVVAIKFTW